MYGKHFESMYEGSMYGAGMSVFAVWGYVIAHTKRSRVELNPRKMADTLGGTIEEIDAVLTKLQRPDPMSRHKQHEGRRLVKEGEFQYFVPSWEDYQKIRNEDERREYNRIAQARHRAKKKGVPQPPVAYKNATSPEEEDRAVTASLPAACQENGKLPAGLRVQDFTSCMAAIPNGDGRYSCWLPNGHVGTHQSSSGFSWDFCKDSAKDGDGSVWRCCLEAGHAGNHKDKEKGEWA